MENLLVQWGSATQLRGTIPRLPFCYSRELFYIIIRVKCNFSPCGLGYFASLVHTFHFSLVGPKRFHRCHFSPLG
ncbi:hypothetical protein Hanom_Chr17g01553091 [Helianthus anomalus]